MAVMVRAPDVDDLVEAANGEFVPVIGDVGGKIGVKPVGAAQHIILQTQLLDICIGLAGLFQIFRQDPAGVQPQSPVLLVGEAQIRQRPDGVGHIAALVKAGLKKPLVVLNAVPGQVPLHLGDVVVQAEPGQRIVAGLFVAVQVLVPFLLIEGAGQLPDIVTVVAVLGEFHGVLALDDLEIPGLQTLGKFLDLVAGVVDIELPPHIGPGLLQHRGQGVAQDAAPGIAHVHGARGVGGYELHHDLLALQGVVAAIVRALALHAGHGIPEPLVPQAEIQKAGTGHLHGGEVGPCQVHVVHQDLGHLAGVLFQGLGGGQAEGGGIVAVGGVLGDLHRRGHGHVLRQQPLGRGLAIGGNGQVQHLVLGDLDHIHGDALLMFLL